MAARFAAIKVDYAVLGGVLANKFFVRRDVAKIFEFRRQKMLELFEGKNGLAD